MVTEDIYLEKNVQKRKGLVTHVYKPKSQNALGKCLE